jgi:WASH complex subunit strumpellin
MSEDFTSKNNDCGQTLLKLISHGQAIIAEILRLSIHIPKVFQEELTKDSKYFDIILDFKYLINEDQYNNKINGNGVKNFFKKRN